MESVMCARLHRHRAMHRCPHHQSDMGEVARRPPATETLLDVHVRCIAWYVPAIGWDEKFPLATVEIPTLRYHQVK